MKKSVFELNKMFLNQEKKYIMVKNYIILNHLMLDINKLFLSLIFIIDK